MDRDRVRVGVKLVRFVVVLRCRESGFPGREVGKLVDGGLGLVDEPVDGLAGAVVAQAVLDVVELDRGVGR